MAKEARKLTTQLTSITNYLDEEVVLWDGIDEERGVAKNPSELLSCVPSSGKSSLALIA